MICGFNKAQLGVVMEKALDDLMLEIQKTQDDEITVNTSAGDFPYKLVMSAGGKSASLTWDHVEQRFAVVGEPLPVTKSVGDVKDWQRPDQVQAPAAASSAAKAPEPEIKVTVDSVVSMFMALTPERRSEFFFEAGRTIFGG